MHSMLSIADRRSGNACRGMNEEQFRRWLQSWCVLNERNLKDAILGFNSAMKLPDAKSSPEVGNPPSAPNPQGLCDGKSDDYVGKVYSCCIDVVCWLCADEADQIRTLILTPDVGPHHG